MAKGTNKGLSRAILDDIKTKMDRAQGNDNDDDDDEEACKPTTKEKKQADEVQNAILQLKKVFNLKRGI